MGYVKEVVKYKVKGMSLRAYCIKKGISYGAVYQRIKSGESVEEAIDNVEAKYIVAKSLTLAEKASIFALRYPKALLEEKKELKKMWYSQKKVPEYMLDRYWDKIVKNSVGVKVSEEIEVWKDIPGYDSYQVSNFSRFRRCITTNDGLTKAYKKCTTYLWNRPDRPDDKVMRICLGNTTLNAAPLILNAFKPRPSEDHIVHFKDGDSTNIALKNLKWVTRKEHGELTGWKCSQTRRVQYVDDEGKVTIYRSARYAAKQLKCSYQTILDICHGKVKKKMHNVSFYE